MVGLTRFSFAPAVVSGLRAAHAGPGERLLREQALARANDPYVCNRGGGSVLVSRGGSILASVEESDGSTAQIELGDPGNGGWSIVEQGDYLYFTDLRCMKFGRVPKLGGTPSFVKMPEQPDGGGAYVAVDATHVFCGHQTKLWMAPKDGGTALQLAVVMLHEAVGPLVSDGSNVYWVNKRIQLGTHQENLAMVSKTGGDIRDLGRLGLGAAVLRLDSNRNRLYWTSYGSGPNDMVFSFSLADKTITRLADKQNVLGGMAQDENYVYWCSKTAIMRVPK